MKQLLNFQAFFYYHNKEMKLGTAMALTLKSLMVIVNSLQLCYRQRVQNQYLTILPHLCAYIVCVFIQKDNKSGLTCELLWNINITNHLEDAGMFCDCFVTSGSFEVSFLSYVKASMCHELWISYHQLLSLINQLLFLGLPICLRQYNWWMQKDWWLSTWFLIQKHFGLFQYHPWLCFTVWFVNIKIYPFLTD